MLRYAGTGWLPGIPARDLTDDEASIYGKARLLKSGLYKETRAPKPLSTPIEAAERTGKQPEEINDARN